MPLQLPPPDTITIERKTTRADSADGSVTLEGDVVVRYGETRVLADRLVLYRTQQRGVAEGNVMIIDPDGTAQADRIEFSYDPLHRSATADRMVINVGGARLKARRATLEPGTWTLLDAEGTTCYQPRATYYVTSDRIVITPGKVATIHEPRVSFLGKYLGELPSQRASLTPAVPGIGFPNPTYKMSRGFGITWQGGLVAGPDQIFTFSARTFQFRKPAAFAQLTRSFLPIDNATEIIAPRSDFRERFAFGYLDSVAVETPREEEKYLRASRLNLSGGGQLNGSISDRNRGTRYSKIEAVYEGGGQRDGVGLLGTARLQGIKHEDDTMTPRLQFNGSAGLPSIKLGNGLSTIARIDSSLFGGSTLYGWGRAMAGLSYAPAPWLRLSAAGFVSGEGGRPQFDMDPLYSEAGALMRADVAFGGLRLSYLAKNDRARGFYDHEIAINQIIGCFETFYILREHPNDRRLGLSIRVKPLIDLFKRRASDFERNASSSTKNEEKRR